MPNSKRSTARRFRKWQKRRAWRRFSALVVGVILVAVSATLLWDRLGGPSSDQSLNKALAHRDSGAFAASIIELKNALQGDPQNVDLRIALGATYLRVSDYRSAEKELRRALEFGAPLARVLDPLARTLLLQKKYQQVLEEIWPVGLTEKAAADAYVARGRAFAATDQPAQAQTAFRQALEASPQHVDALIESARLAIASGQAREAEQLLDRIAALSPKNLEVTALKGDLYLKSGQYLKAAEQYEQVIVRLPAHVPSKVALADAYLRQGRSDDATKLLDDALLLAPNNFDANYLRAFVAITRNDYDTALKRVERALFAKSDHVGSLIIAGSAALALGQFELAERNLNKVLARVPDDGAANRLLAGLRRQRAQTSLAQRTAQMPDLAFSQLLDDGAAPALVAGASDHTVIDRQALQSGLAYLSKLTHRTNNPSAPGAQDGAIAEFRRLLDLDPQNPSLERLQAELAKKTRTAEIRSLFGQYALLRGKPGEALEQVSAELNTDDAQPELLMIGAIAGLATEQPGIARRALQRLIQLTPASVELSYLLALAHNQSNDQEAYRDAVDRALTIDPAYPPAIAERMRIALADAQIEDAERAAQRLKSAWPDDSVTFDLIAGLALLRNDLATATGLYRQAYDQSPTTMRVLRLAYATQRAGDARTSKDLLTKWVGQHPEDTAAALVLANKYLSANELVEAAELYAIVLRQNPHHIVALNNIAWISLRLGDTAAALKFARQGLALAPENAGLTDTLAEIHMAKGDYEQALTLLLRTTNHEQADPGLRVALARALAKNGRGTQARALLQQTLVTFGDFPDRAAADGLLQQFNE